MSAANGTIFERLMQEKVEGFLPIEDALRKLVNENKFAVYYTLESILGYKEFECKVRDQSKYSEQ